MVNYQACLEMMIGIFVKPDTLSNIFCQVWCVENERWISEQ